MRRQSRAGGKAATAQRREKGTRKSRTAPKAVRPRSSSAAREEAAWAQLTRERDEALEQQAATAEVLKALSGSTFDLQSVLKSLLGKAVRLCSAEMGLIYRQDGDIYRVAASFGHSHDFLEKTNQIPIRPDRGSATGRAVLERRVVHIPDTLADADYRWGVNIRSEKEMHRTILAVPMLKGDAIIGVIVIRRTQVQPFTDRQVAVLSSFADQAVVAIENARLINDLRESLQQQTATADVLKVISRSTFELETVLNTLLESAARLCEARRGVMFRRDGDSFHGVAFYNTSPEMIAFVKSRPIKPGRHTITARVALERRTIHVADLQADPEYNYVRRDIDPIRTELGVPMFRGNDLIGVIILYKLVVQPFTDKQIELVTTFADQAVIAIENVRLFEAEQHRTCELSESLEYQTAISDVLNVISRSPNALQPVLDTIVQTAARLCEADFSVFFRLHEGKCHIGASNAEDDFIALAREKPFIPTRASCTGRALLEQRTVHVLDASTDPEYAMPDYQHVANNRTMLGVPLLRDGVALGSITLWKTRVEPFTENQIELITTFADQAVIAIANVRLFEAEQQRTHELSESLAQQTATSDVLRVISSSPTDIQPVLETIGERAEKLCDAEISVVSIVDGELIRVASIHGMTEAGVHAARRAFPMRPTDETIHARTVLARSVCHVADVLSDPQYQLKDTAQASGYRGCLGVPMVRDVQVVGAIVVARRQPGLFSDTQVQLLKTFADQAVIAIENVRLFKETKNSLEQQTATADVLKVISRSTFDLQTVLDTLVGSAALLCGAPHGLIFRFDGTSARAVAAHNNVPGFKELWADNPILPNRCTATGRAIVERRAIHIPDVLADPEYNPPEGSLKQAQKLGQYRTTLVVPMLRERFPLGAITLWKTKVEPFTDKQIELVTTFADQAVIAIENARLLNELRQRTDDLTESLEQQTGTSEILEVISNSPTDSQPAFDAIVRSGLRLFPNAVVVISLPDGDQVKLAAIAGADADDREKLRARYPLPLSREYITSTAMMDARELDFADAHEAPVELISGARNFLASGYHGITVVPMLRGDTAIGAISIVRRQPGALTEKQRELLRTFASQAVIAIENTRLFHELRARTDDLGRSVGELRALGEVSQAVNSTLDLETVLSTIVAKAVQLSSTEAGAIYVFDDLQREFHLRATYGMDQAMIDSLTQRHISLDNPNFAQALAQPEPVQIADLNEQPTSAVNDIILRAGFRALLVAPLVRGEDAVGMLVVRRRSPGGFPQNTVDLIKTFAAQSAVAIENARLFQNVEASLEDLRTAQDRLVQTQKLASLGQLTAGIAHEIKNPLNFINNFSGVSTELIDELQETLGKVKADTSTLAEIAELTNTLRDNLDKIVQHGKRADAIVKNMLLHSREGSGEHRQVDVNALVEEAVSLAYHGARAEKQGFNITLERTLDPAAGQVDCFPQEITRVLLNLISNGFYAATKRKAQVNGGYEPTLTAATRNLGDRVEIRIRDNGTGIPPEVRDKMFNPFFTTKPAGEGTGLGLSISHDIIVKQHAGSIDVETQPGEFTEVRIILPRAAVGIAAGQA